MKILKALFALVLLMFPLGEVVRLNFGEGVAVKPLDVSVFVLVVVWLTLKLVKKQKFRQKRIMAPLLLFSLSGLIPLIVNNLELSLNEIVISFIYFLRWLIYIFTFFVIFDFDDKFKKKISTLLVVIGSVVVGLGYIQYFYYSDLHNLRYLGWDEHMHRMFSTFMDPNFAGAFFVLFFLFLVSKFLKQKKILIGFLCLLTLIATLLTFSRSALIMLAMSSCVLFVLENKKRFILWLALIIIAFFSMSSSYFNIENMNLLRVVSSEARLETARNALTIVKENPVLGVGFNTYKYYQIKYGFRNETAFTSHADAAPDNSILFVLATTGIVGFALYALLWFRILKTASYLAIASVIGVFINSMFINSLFYPFIMLWLWIIIGLKRNKSL